MAETRVSLRPAAQGWRERTNMKFQQRIRTGAGFAAARSSARQATKTGFSGPIREDSCLHAYVAGCRIENRHQSKSSSIRKSGGSWSNRSDTEARQKACRNDLYSDEHRPRCPLSITRLGSRPRVIGTAEQHCWRRRAAERVTESRIRSQRIPSPTVWSGASNLLRFDCGFVPKTAGLSLVSLYNLQRRREAQLALRPPENPTFSQPIWPNRPWTLKPRSPA